MPQAYAIRLTLIASILVVAQAVSAQAALFQFNFVGTITANDTTGPLKGLLNPNFPNAEDGVSGSYGMTPARRRRHRASSTFPAQYFTRCSTAEQWTPPA